VQISHGMSRHDLDLNETIEEVRELLYDITKQSETCVDSETLEKEYDRQFVQTGIARPLPAAWLRYVKAADEFEVKQEGGQTFISVVQHGKIPVIKDLTISNDTTFEETPIAQQEIIDLKPLSLSTLPTSKTKVHVLSLTDPGNLSIRLTSWDPMPDYLYSALSKDFTNESNCNHRVVPVEGMICAAKLPNGSWERVKIVKSSKLMHSKGFYVVYAVDVGIYHLVNQKNLQPLSSAICGFKNYLLAKCQLANIKPANNSKFWSRESQLALDEWLSDAQGTEIEMVPVGEWILSDGPITVPLINADLLLNGESISQKLVKLGFAEESN